MLKYFQFIIFLLSTLVALLSIYVYELHSTVALLKDNYNELLINNATLMKEFNELKIISNQILPTSTATTSSIDSFSLEYCLSYLPYIFGACSIACITIGAIGLYTIHSSSFSDATTQTSPFDFIVANTATPSDMQSVLLAIYYEIQKHFIIF